MSDDDPTQRQVYSAPHRFGCGAIVAGMVGLVILARFIRPSWPAFGILSVMAIVGGWIALRGGDRAPFRMLEHFFRMLGAMFYW